MVDSRAKGQRAEYQVRDMLRVRTGFQWERVPGSGGFGPQHGLKGDIYIPSVNTRYCIEVKHYKDDVINSNLLRKSESQLEKFWLQTVRESEQIDKEPLLVFKKDRGRWIIALEDEAKFGLEKNMYYQSESVYIFLYDFEEWLNKVSIKEFLK